MCIYIDCGCSVTFLDIWGFASRHVFINCDECPLSPRARPPILVRLSGTGYLDGGVGVRFGHRTYEPRLTRSVPLWTGWFHRPNPWHIPIDPRRRTVPSPCEETGAPYEPRCPPPSSAGASHTWRGHPKGRQNLPRVGYARFETRDSPPTPAVTKRSRLRTR